MRVATLVTLVITLQYCWIFSVSASIMSNKITVESKHLNTPPLATPNSVVYDYVGEDESDNNVEVRPEPSLEETLEIEQQEPTKLKTHRTRVTNDIDRDSRFAALENQSGEIVMIDLRADMKPQFNVDWNPEMRLSQRKYLYYILKSRHIWASIGFLASVLSVMVLVVVAISCDRRRHSSLQDKYCMREAGDDLPESDDSLI